MSEYAGNGQYNHIVWTFFLLLVGFMLTFIMMRLRKNRKRKRIQKQEYQDMIMEYENLTLEKINSCPDENLIDVVMESIREKENRYEDYFDRISYPQKVAYGIVLLNECVSGGTGIRPFFHSPATEKYVPVIDQYLEEIGAFDAATILRYARRLDEIFEKDLPDEDMGEYSTYNFSDFTHEYISLVAGTNFMPNLTQYIRNHAVDFVSQKEID